MPTRVVIVGGGFAGLKAAQTLERLSRASEEIEITLISRDNFLLFTPFLTEALGGMLDEADIVSPIRAFLKRARFIMGEVTGIDLAAKTVTYHAPLSETVETISADHLILGLGGTTSFYGREDIQRVAFTLKSLDDSSLLRNHLVALLEEADTTRDPEDRQALLTIVAVGAGYTGVEAAGAIRDFLRESTRDYPNIRPDEIRVVLVDKAERILPTLAPDLADYAARQLAKRGIEIVLGQEIAEASETCVTLSGGAAIPSRTLLWSAGVMPSPMTRSLGCGLDKRGAILTEPTMAVPGFPGVWAMGDCAHIPNLLEDGRPYPGTAQHAEREAKQIAKNVLAVVRGESPQPFLYRTLGEFINLGHYVAVAQIKRVKLSGFIAWWMWRTVYLGKIPHWSRKFRVVSGWTMDLLFGRMAVETETPRLLRGHLRANRPSNA